MAVQNPPKRLAKVATEFNLSKDMVIEFLKEKGITIENNPNAKLEPEFYDLIKNEFSESKQKKEDFLALKTIGEVAKENNISAFEVIQFLKEKGFTAVGEYEFSRLTPVMYQTISKELFPPEIINNEPKQSSGKREEQIKKNVNNELDLEIYKGLIDDLNVTEIYLGHIQYAFHYSKVQYTATCTEAFPFNPFDKVICEILKVEEQLSFETIGEILGLNVYASENPKRYLDLAEKEILMEALQSLASTDFRMIEGGDINFSSCKLTPIGKEYAEKKNKFKSTTNKPFTLFFDHTTENNLLAKQLFEFVDGKITGKEFAIPSDEADLKEIAAVQIPEIYNPEKQHSFTDAILKNKRNFSINYPIAITFNLKENLFHFYCYDVANRKIHKPFNDWINSNEKLKQDLLKEFLEMNSADSKSINTISSVITEQISTFSPSTKISNVKTELLKMEFVDEHLLISFFDELFNVKNRVEIYLCLPYFTESISKSIRNIIQNSENENSRFFFVFPIDVSEKSQKEIDALKILSTKSSGLFVMQQKVKSFSFSCKGENESFYLDYIACSIEKFQKIFTQRKIWDKRALKIEKHLLEKFSDEHALIICDKVNAVINFDIQKTVSKEQLDELSFYEFKLEPFASIGKQGETVNLTLELINNFKEDRIERLKDKLNNQIDTIETRLSMVANENEFNELQNLFNATNAEMLFDDSVVFRKCESLKILLTSKKEEFAEAKRIFSFIIDTNVFIKDPEIISKIQPKNRVIIAAKVLDELDGFKANLQLKDVASKSIREIFNDKNKNIRRAKANVKLLPPDFSKRAPDNLILAVALMYKDNNGILISDDKGLHEKAKTVEMQVISYEEFITKFVTSKK